MYCKIKMLTMGKLDVEDTRSLCIIFSVNYKSKTDLILKVILKSQPQALLNHEGVGGIFVT